MNIATLGNWSVWSETDPRWRNNGTGGGRNIKAKVTDLGGYLDFCLRMFGDRPADLKVTFTPYTVAAPEKPEAKAPVTFDPVPSLWADLEKED